MKSLDFDTPLKKRTLKNLSHKKSSESIFQIKDVWNHKMFACGALFQYFKDYQDVIKSGT